MRYERALTFVFEDEGWIGKILLGGFLLFGGVFIFFISITMAVAALTATSRSGSDVGTAIVSAIFAIFLGMAMSVAPSLIATGYVVRTVRWTVDGNSGLPRWAAIGELFIDGAKLTIAGVLYLAPAVMFVIALVLSLLGSGGDPALPELTRFLLIELLLIGYVGVLIGLYPALLALYSRRGRVTDALSVIRAARLGLRHPAEYLLIPVIMVGVGYIINPLLLLTLFIGFPFLMFWTLMVLANLVGQYDRLADEERHDTRETLPAEPNDLMPDDVEETDAMKHDQHGDDGPP